jgi:phosphatidylglycerophosphate synthase
MVAIPLLLYYEPLGPVPVAQLGYWLLWLAAALTVWSMGYYLSRAWPEIRRKGF